MPKPLWLIEAQRHVGLKEIKGARHNRFIVLWLKTLRAWWFDDETPWCGTFVAHCIQSCKYQLPKYWMRALDWLNWGQELEKPSVGCIVVFSREGGGHVGFVVGRDAAGNLMVLGGNQGDSVKISPFDPARVLGYRWPSQCAKPVDCHLPLLDSDGKLSNNEA